MKRKIFVQPRHKQSYQLTERGKKALELETLRDHLHQLHTILKMFSGIPQNLEREIFSEIAAVSHQISALETELATNNPTLEKDA